MRELTQKLRGLLLLPAFIGCSLASAQVTCRVPQTASTQKTEGITAEVPCAGSVLLSEDFENGIPVGWTVIDGDTLTPRAQMQLQKGWQSRTDYRDSSNKVVVSPSWYENPGKSDDWLITPPITLGSNPCLSWKAYSQDIYYKEAYEVRVALTPDTAAFLANAVIDEDDATSGTPHQLAATLGAWAGQTVYIAFRQVSDDKFVLALDDVKVTNVNVNDIGVYAVTYGSPDPGDTVTLRFQVANYGSDTVTNFQALYSLAGGPAKFMTIGTVSIPPNGTVSFDHDSTFVSDTLDAFYDVCAWTTLPNSVLDEELLNDTLCLSVAVGSPVGRPDPVGAGIAITLFPNPCNDAFSLMPNGLQHVTTAQVRIIDLGGRLLWSEESRLLPNEAKTISTAGFGAGMYFVELRVEGKPTTVRKLIRR